MTAFFPRTTSVVVVSFAVARQTRGRSGKDGRGAMVALMIDDVGFREGPRSAESAGFKVAPRQPVQTHLRPRFQILTPGSHRISSTIEIELKMSTCFGYLCESFDFNESRRSKFCKPNRPWRRESDSFSSLLFFSAFSVVPREDPSSPLASSVETMRSPFVWLHVLTTNSRTFPLGLVAVLRSDSSAGR